MKKTRGYTVMAIIVVMTVTICACGVNDDVKFNGSKTRNENQFDMAFDVLNTTYTHKMIMEEGESIAVSIEKEAGEITVLIQQDSQEPIYRGDDVQSGAFTVAINEAGTYTLSVTGKKARGRVSFSRSENSNGDKESFEP